MEDLRNGLNIKRQGYYTLWMETKATSKNHHLNNSNIQLLISYNHMHLIVTYCMDIVFNTKSIRWKVLVTWVFLSGHMILRTTIPFSCFLSWWPWCWNLWEPGDDEAGQSSCVIDHCTVPGQRTESAHWGGARPWCLTDEPALLSSDTTWHVHQPRQLEYEIVEWTWLKWGSFLKEREYQKKRKGLIISTMIGTMVTTVQAVDV